MDALVAVRGRIARAIAGAEPSSDARLGAITLMPHQIDAVRRLRFALGEFGGALLADAPGLGKTYVALAVARAVGGAGVAAPAALRAQWLESAAAAAVPIVFHSLETLSRRGTRVAAPLLIVDEAHHLRNAHTRRYAQVAALAIGKQVLLLSATPVHNRTADRDALLALFLGGAAKTVDASTLAQMIVRREADPALLPRHDRTRWLVPPRTPHIAPQLASLPPPLPAADGADAAALVRITLAHAWSSSLAALDETVRRSMQRAAAIDDALAAGRWPTRRELRAWITTPESSQLAFPELVASAATLDIAAARATIAEHLHAMKELRTRIAHSLTVDAVARANLLRRILRAHPQATVIAFARYAGTVDALWRALRLDAGVVALTARGVRSAGGGLRRDEVLAMLTSQVAASDDRVPLRLVLSTDLLGEGLNLPAASVIVHLDQPWTPARIDQREGRVTRLGSPHAVVTVYAVRAPRGAERLLQLADRLRHKRTVLSRSIAPGVAREELRALVQPWLSAAPGRSSVAAVTSAASAWLAALRDPHGQVRVIASVAGGPATEDDALIAALLRQTMKSSPTRLGPRQIRSARREIARWLRAEASAHLAQSHDSPDAVRAALVRHLDAALRATPLHRRAAMRARVSAVRSHLTQIRGAGADRALVEAARHEQLDDLLDAIERIAIQPREKLSPARGARLLALLLLVAE